MTGLSNADVVAQLGWTLQIIYNSTGGRLARYWRPPYGDTDARVSAIAREVFGLTTVIWNNEYVLFLNFTVVLLVSKSCFSSQDWTLGSQGGTTPQAIQANFQHWLSGPQNPGLIVLEHELSDGAVQAFQAAYPLMKQYNWVLKSVALLAGLNPYQNVADDTSQPTLVALTAGGNGGAGLTAGASPSSSSTPPPTSTGSGSGSSSKATAAPDNSSKKSGAVPGLNLSPVASLVSTLALVFSLYLI
jgi:chitin deacetylase